jgi:hypothetical protein
MYIDLSRDSFDEHQFPWNLEEEHKKRIKFYSRFHHLARITLVSTILRELHVTSQAHHTCRYRRHFQRQTCVLPSRGNSIPYT